jgi:anti-anti-sigma factor
VDPALRTCDVAQVVAQTWLVTRSTVDGDALVVSLAGELDLAGRASVATACTDGLHRSVTVDLSGLTFMDCAGYTGLHQARNAVVERGGTFALTNATGEPARLLGLIKTAEAPSSASPRRADAHGDRPVFGAALPD